jgi:hypothetical protein
MPHCPTCETDFADELLECPTCAAEEESGEVYRCPRCHEDYRGRDACPACGAVREPVPCDDHPERPAAGRCVICGKALCDSCQETEARAFLCPDHRDIVVIEGWAQVYSTTSEFEARLVAENLRAEGIDAQAYSQKDNMFTVELGELSIVRVLSPVLEYEHALGVIRAHMDTEGEVVFACPACGEAYDPGARECAACGAPLA